MIAFWKNDLDAQYKDAVFSSDVDVSQFAGNNIKTGLVKLEILDKAGKPVFTQEKRLSVGADSISTLLFNGTVRNPTQ